MKKSHGWTDERLRALSVPDRHQLLLNARSKSTVEAKALAETIETLGLPYTEATSLKESGPLYLKLWEIVFSLEGRAAGARAAEGGLPALAGVDPLLAQGLGADYGKHNRTTLEAGYLVAEMMRSQGFRSAGKQGKLPSTCVAKTAEIFVPVQ